MPARPGLPPIPPPPPRRGWALPALAAALALLVGVTGTLLAVSAGDDGEDRVTSAGATAAPTAPPSPAPPPTPPPPPPPPPGGPVTFEGVGLQLPPGWLLQGQERGRACVTRTAGVCELAVVLPDVVSERGSGTVAAPEPDEPLGWHLGTEPPSCQAGFAKGRLVVRRLRPVDDKKAAYREWDVTCGGDPFSPARPRLWWLPETGLAFVDLSDDPAVDAVLDDIVAGAELSAVAAE